MAALALWVSRLPHAMCSIANAAVRALCGMPRRCTCPNIRRPHRAHEHSFTLRAHPPLQLRALPMRPAVLLVSADSDMEQLMDKSTYWCVQEQRRTRLGRNNAGCGVGLPRQGRETVVSTSPSLPSTRRTAWQAGA